MSRRRKVYKKEEKVDSRYGSPAVARLISTVMKRGKKALAERIKPGSSETPADAVQRGFVMTLGRPPSADAAQW